MSSIVIPPDEYNYPIKDNYSYPFEELAHQLDHYVYCLITPSIKHCIDSEIYDFRHKLFYKFNVPQKEQDEFNFAYTLEQNTKLESKNLFTACLMHGYYIPYYLVENKDSFALPDGSIIKYDYELSQYVLNIKLNL